MFASLLPPGVRVVEASAWMFEQPVHVAEEAVIQRAVPGRRAEFRAGRHAAHQALRDLGVPCPSLLPGHQREPLWPEGVVGTITHTGSYCVAAVARHPPFVGIAIDAEEASPLAADSLPLICRAEEQHALPRYAAEGLSNACKVIFSAKECIHKIYFPLNRHTLEFTDACIELDTRTGRFNARILQPAPRPDTVLRELQGRYAIADGKVFTCIAITSIVQGIAECSTH